MKLTDPIAIRGAIAPSRACDENPLTVIAPGVAGA